MLFKKEKREVAYFMRRLYDTGLTTTSGGNISLRLTKDKIAITSSTTDKARIKSKEIAIVSLDGTNTTPRLKPSIETGMHLLIYRTYPEIQAIVHAHPALATSFTAMKKKANCKLIAESRAIIGEPSWASYALMGTEELARIVAEKCKNAKVVFMENHGILATGKSLLEAFDRIEVTEAATKITLITELLKDKSELTNEQLIAIDNLMS